MNIEKMERFFTLLRKNGVTHYKDDKIEVNLSDVPRGTVKEISSPLSSQPKVPQSHEKDSTPLAAVPPTELQIPHHLNEMASLLKLNDEALVEKLFPDFTQMEAKA